MATGMQDVQGKIAPFIAEGESGVDAVTNESLTFVLTDRRLISFREPKNDDSTIVESRYLDRVSETKVTHDRGNDFDQENATYGAISLVVGLISLMTMGIVDGGPAMLAGLTGTVLVVSAIALLFEAFDTKDGTVTLEFRDDSGDEIFNHQFDETQMDFIQNISTAVSSAHRIGTRKRVSA